LKSDNFALNKPSKALLGYLGAGFLCKAIGILTTPIFTRLLSESDYGSLAFFLSLSGILLGILSPLVSGSQIYGILSKSGERAENVFLSGLFPIFSVTLLISAALFSTSLFFGWDLIFPGLLSLQILSDSVLFLYLTVKRYEYRGATVAVITVAESVLSPILSIGLIRLSGGGYLWRIAGLILPPLFISAFLILLQIWRGAVATSSLAGKILKECAPLVPSSFLGAIGGYKDRLLTAFLLDAE
jgi:O-antigen/teichoic acid export membrane protein